MPFHVELHSGGVFSGESASAWDLDEAALRERYLALREQGEQLWVQGRAFDWQDTKLRIFEGPLTTEIPDFTSALGQAVFEMNGHLRDVTDVFIDGPSGGVAPPPEIPGDAIFVVHGTNSPRREEVARFLSMVVPGEVPVLVLHELANRGRTLIEKFEATAGQAQYAVAVLTADDEARPRGGESWELRGRQNVVFELGFFFGKLGRERVAVLYEGGVERPSDIDGLVYIALDEAGAWKLALGREMRAAGLDADLNRLAHS